ncbi:MAG: hypothetical protein H5T70_05495 [Chloroflexi bacterium]|nr:hypothetical protein [Chloroflexota bacterium]
MSFRDMFNLRGINWWMLLGGVGLNLFISLMSALVGTYLSVNETTADFYMRYGQALMMLAVFILCGLAGFLISRLSDDVPLKHAFLSSMGAFIPFFAVGVLTFNIMLILVAIVAVAGALNGGILGLPKRHYWPDR